MSLLIDNDMNLPNSCSKCPLKYSSYDMYCCRMIYGDGSIVCVDSYTERRNPACPLVEIPTPHGRLIDADRLIRRLNGIEYIANAEGGRPTFSEILEEIAKAPTIIEKEDIK